MYVLMYKLEFVCLICNFELHLPGCDCNQAMCKMQSLAEVFCIKKINVVFVALQLCTMQIL